MDLADGLKGDRKPHGSAGAFSSLRLVGDAVMIRHTLFSLPFVLSAILLESSGKPAFVKLLGILLAATGARNAANALNRLIDSRIDSMNPRTADRPLPSGKLGARALWLFTAAMVLMLVLGTALLNTLCLALLPLAGALVFGYSYTKRFTWLCHFWLGITCSAATMGAFLGLSGRFEARYFPIVAAVALWVAGFDILYALQDIDFDRSHGLHSVPARFGPRAARAIAALCHAGTVLGLASVFFFWKAPRVGTAAAILLCTILIAAEHIIALGGTEKHIRVAAYGINEIIPAIFLFGIVLDTYLL